MIELVYSSIKSLTRLSPSWRKFILLNLDLFSLALSVIISGFILNLDHTFRISSISSFFTLFFFLLALIIYIFTGQYTSITRFINSKIIYKLFLRNTIIITITFFFNYIFFANKSINLSFWILILFFVSLIQGMLRISARDFLLNRKKKNSLIRTTIYGCGSAGAQLAESLSISNNYEVKFFLDDDPNLWNRTLKNIKIINPKELKNIKNEIDQVLIAIPSLSNKRLRKIIEKLKDLNISVLKIPSLDELTSREITPNQLRSISPEDLLARDRIKPIKKLIGPDIINHCICVTGAGGSIGSELCRQIASLKPSLLILIDNSEENLYLISNELQEKFGKLINFKPILADAAYYKLIKKLFLTYKVSIIFHAAAYKHVPIVESNPLQGISNNVFSTDAICRAAEESNVKKVILISTDKAVRPTNVMGASKRLAELIIQSYAYKNEKLSKKKENTKTCYSMVRFGNVLGSSGSVVPLFKKQIALGGPVTVTHKNVIRYFMTIPEAAELVLQSATLAKGGEVFILDMGEPVKIAELAQNMIKLSGLSVKDNDNPKGDIEIIYSGLRDGEKLYEELLIDENSEQTEHPLILKANEKFIKPETLWPKVNLLKEAIINLEQKKVLSLLSELIT